jgi:hypothetical protein
MSNSEWCYKVKLVMGTVYDDVIDPEFSFSRDEKDKMLDFIDILLENGQEVSIVMESIKE